MTWTKQTHPEYPDIEIEMYKDDNDRYNRTYYYDKPSRKQLGVVWGCSDMFAKKEDWEQVLNEQKRIIEMNKRFCSFDGVAKMYADTIPLRGARKAEDVRPIWKRRYWWRRVVRINENKYVLHDGDYTWQRTFAESCDLAPITWERKPDGDYLTIRNCGGTHYSVTRYMFLTEALPRELYFKIDNGKHYIVQGDTEHYLPKFKMHYDHSAGKQIIDQDIYLTFKAKPDGTFERITEKLPMKTRRIDKDLKTKYDPLIKELWAWGCAVLPILGETMHEWQTRSDFAGKLIPSGSAWNWSREIASEEARKILENPDDERRLALCAMSAWQANAFNNSSHTNKGFKGFNDYIDYYRAFKKVLRKVVDVSAVELR